MAKILDGTLKAWQDTETIHASEYNQEREIIRAAINDNDTRLREVESSLGAVQLGTAQLQKITSDTGDVKLSVTDIFKNVLTEILALGRGMHTFYAVGGSKGLPPSNLSIRGMAHLTTDTTGWVYATDYNNQVFTNYCDNGKWTGWDKLVKAAQEDELWTGGSTGKFMQAGQIVTPSKKLTECANGWILVWSDYDDATNKASNYDFHYSFVPKFIATRHNGSGHLFSVPRTPDALIVKYVNVANDKITGVAGNEVAPDNDVVLRYVLEW